MRARKRSFISDMDICGRTETGRRIPTVVSEGERVFLFSQCLESEAAFGKALGSGADAAAVRLWALHSRPTLDGARSCACMALQRNIDKSISVDIAESRLRFLSFITHTKVTARRRKHITIAQ